ncbi:MAG: thymidylate kinase [Chloroflexi bacterium]|nr:thymidylate kinase [Chloroflexota bacterium]
MTEVRFYGRGLSGVLPTELPGRLIVLEGPDGVGRSTQIALLREWLEANGYAVYSSGLKRSELASVGINEAKAGHTLGYLTMALFYAADLADRLEREIIPALRAGFVVLTDRYLYSLIARAEVRGVDPQWVRSLFGFALVPDAIFYLRTDLDNLMIRVLSSRGFDFWESGMDYLGRSDYYESYVEYQGRMLAAFSALGREFGFRDIDATQGIRDVFVALRDGIAEIVSELKPSRVGELAAQVPLDGASVAASDPT